MYSQSNVRRLNRSFIKVQRVLINGLLLFLSMNSYGADTPLEQTHATPSTLETVKPFSLTYSARYAGLPFSGKATRTLQFDPATKQYTLATQANSFLMKLREKSQFLWDHQQCRAIPIRYEYRRSGVGKNRHHWIEFTTNQAKATYYSKNKKGKIEKHTYQTPAAVADRLSEIPVLRCHLMQGVTSDITIDLARKGKIATHTFRIVTEEVIKTPIGHLETIKVARVNKGDDKQTFAWFAPQLDYWLIRLEQIDDGKRYTVSLEKAE